VTSDGRVYKNDEKDKRKMLKTRPNTIVVESTGVYSIKSCQYFKEKGVKVL
jgi:transposase